MDSIKALDHMLDDDLLTYRCDPWYSEPGASYYHSLEGISGQYNYKGAIFFIARSPGRHGSGGMDQGHPESVTVTRIEI